MWNTVKDRMGQNWAVDWEQFNNVVTSYAYMRAFTEMAHIRSEVIPWGFDIKVVDFDHAKMRKRKQAIVNKLVGELIVELSTDGRAVFRRLSALRGATGKMREDSADLFHQADASAKKSVALSEVAVSLTQLTRDVAITCIAIVGAPAGGAVAFAGVIATAGGTALAKYQDTGNKDAALIAGTGSLIIAGAGKCAGLLDKGEKAGKAIFIVGGITVDTMFEYVGAKAEKKSNGDAFKASFMKGIFSSLGATADAMSPLAKTFDEQFERVRQTALSLSRSDAGALAGKGALEAGKKAIEVGSGKIVDAKSKSSKVTPASISPGPAGEYIGRYVLCPI